VLDHIGETVPRKFNEVIFSGGDPLAANDNYWPQMGPGPWSQIPSPTPAEDSFTPGCLVVIPQRVCECAFTLDSRYAVLRVGCGGLHINHPLPEIDAC